MENKESFDVLVQDAVTALNRIIVSDEMAKNSRAIVKVSHFREWLKDAASKYKSAAPSKTTADENDWQY